MSLGDRLHGNDAHSDRAFEVGPDAVSRQGERCLRSNRSCSSTALVAHEQDARAAIAEARAWLAERESGTLCIAGPRESEAPGITAKAKAFLAELFEG